jgi:hypothetical protein
VQDCLVAINSKTILQSPYLLVMAPAVCFLFAKLKTDLAVICDAEVPPDDLGWGAEDHRRRGLRGGVTAAKEAMKKVCLDQ